MCSHRKNWTLRLMLTCWLHSNSLLIILYQIILCYKQSKPLTYSDVEPKCVFFVWNTIPFCRYEDRLWSLESQLQKIPLVTSFTAGENYQNIQHFSNLFCIIIHISAVNSVEWSSRLCWKRSPGLFEEITLVLKRCTICLSRKQSDHDWLLFIALSL